MLKNKKFSFSVLGSNISSEKKEKILESAFKIGAEIANRKSSLLVPSEPGVSLWAAKGSNSKDGVVIAFDIRSNKNEREKISLNQDYYDSVIYTNSSVSGRDLMLFNACDAVIFTDLDPTLLADISLCAGEKKVIGLLDGDWSSDLAINSFVSEISKTSRLIRDKNPIALLDRIFDLLSSE